MWKILGTTAKNLVARATGCPVFMHPCCNEPSGSIQHRDFFTDSATELYSKVLNTIYLIPIVSFLRTRFQAVPLQRYFVLFVFLSQLSPYTRQFSTSPDSIIVLSRDICHCTVSGQTQNLLHSRPLQLYHLVAKDDVTVRGRQHLHGDDCPRFVEPSWNVMACGDAQEGGVKGETGECSG